MKAYCEYVESANVFIRTFLQNTEEDELKWHWDEEDRIIESLHPTDWQFQFDNRLPIDFSEPVFCSQGTIHRVIKGTGDLQLKITKVI